MKNKTTGFVKVTLNQGTFVGSVLSVSGESIQSYKGIPYALPPVGERRWRLAEPVAEGNDERNALAYAPACVQPQTHKTSDFYYSAIPQMSEDCLYLNIWAPYKKQNLAPVMVFIHGGSLVHGCASGFEGSQLARQGIVVVTINYRLNIFGYFAHPELSAESENGVSGNYGVTDQIQALRWVKENIAAFGGDKDNVTIAGHSAGAYSVCLLMATPLTKGLFHKAIAQSGILPSMSMLKVAGYGKPSAELSGKSYAELLGKSTLKDLRSLPAESLVAPLRAMNSREQIPDVVVDGWLFEKQLIEMFEEGSEHDLPFMVGYTTSESSYMESEYNIVFPQGLDNYVEEFTGRYGEFSSEFFRLYPGSDIRCSVMDSLGEGFFGWAAEKYAICKSKQHSDTYFYCVNHIMQWADEMGVGAYHGIDVMDLFSAISDPNSSSEIIIGSLENFPVININETDRKTSEIILNYWSSFVKRGVPYVEGCQEWKSFSDDYRNQMLFHNGYTELCLKPDNDKFNFHEKIIRRRRRDGESWSYDVGILTPIKEKG